MDFEGDLKGAAWSVDGKELMLTDLGGLLRAVV